MQEDSSETRVRELEETVEALKEKLDQHLAKYDRNYMNICRYVERADKEATLTVDAIVELRKRTGNLEMHVFPGLAGTVLEISKIIGPDENLPEPNLPPPSKTSPNSQ